MYNLKFKITAGKHVNLLRIYEFVNLNPIFIFYQFSITLFFSLLLIGLSSFAFYILTLINKWIVLFKDVILEVLTYS